MEGQPPQENEDVNRSTNENERIEQAATERGTTVKPTQSTLIGWLAIHQALKEIDEGLSDFEAGSEKLVESMEALMNWRNFTIQKNPGSVKDRFVVQQCRSKLMSCRERRKEERVNTTRQVLSE